MNFQVEEQEFESYVSGDGKCYFARNQYERSNWEAENEDENAATVTGNLLQQKMKCAKINLLYTL